MSARHDAPRGPVLIILHQEHSCPARIGRLLHTMGFELDVRRPRFGDPLPGILKKIFIVNYLILNTSFIPNLKQIIFQLNLEKLQDQ